MNAAYSAKELSRALDMSVRAVQLRATREAWPSAEETCRGGRIKKYGPSGFLPKDVQAKISDHMLRSTLQNVTAIAPLPNTLPGISNGNGNGCLLNKVNLTNTHKYPIALPPAILQGGKMAGGPTALPERADKTGLAKYDLVSAWRRAVATQPHSKKGEATDAFLLAYRSGRLLPQVWAVLGDVSRQTLYRLDKNLRDASGDYHAIADGRGGWKKHGTNLYRPRAISEAAQQALLCCWLRPEKPTVSLAIRAARMVLERKGAPEQCEESTWRRWLRDFERRNQHIVVMAREGEKAYRDQVGPYITRDTSQLKVGQVLVADGHDLNFQVIHPQTGKPARLKLIMFFDWASRMPVGWQVMPTENTAAISAALRNAILNLGRVPDVVYLDNGKAFKSRFFTETDPDLRDLTGIYARLSIGVMFATPYNARAKVVERFFLTMQEQFERLMPSFCGSSISDKPAWRARNEKFHRSLHEKRTSGYVPNIREVAWLLSLYVEWYGRQPHAGLGGKRPLDVLDAGRGSGVDVAELDREFLWSKKVSPRRCRVTLYGIDYESDCLYGWGDDVIARYDTADLSEIFIYTLDGRRLGEAKPVQALSPIARMLGDQVSVDQVTSEIKRQRRLAKQTKANLIELGADPEKVESLDALPWNQRMAVISGGKTGDMDSGSRTKDFRDDGRDDGVEIDQAERARLELVASQAESELTARAARAPELERPEYWRSEHHRYEWAWRAVHEHHAQISNEDAAFIAYFETTEEYKENYESRYTSLRKLYP